MNFSEDSISILGIRLGQSQETLIYLVPDVYKVSERGQGLESWSLVGGHQSEWPYNLRFVDGTVSRITGKCLSINDKIFDRNVQRCEVCAELPHLQKSWNEGWSFMTKSIELNIIFDSRLGNDYLLEDKRLLNIWMERWCPEESWLSE